MMKTDEPNQFLKPRQARLRAHDSLSKNPFGPQSLVVRLFRWACILMAVVPPAVVGSLCLTDTAEAACTQAPADSYVVTTLIADRPIQASSDPDFEEVLKDNARIAVESGEWGKRMREKEAFLLEWSKAPAFPESRPQAVTTTLTRKSTGLTDEARKATEALDAFSRFYLIFDAGNGAQMQFAQRLLSAGTWEIRPVVAGGSVEAARTVLGMRVWADQGSVLTRRLGLMHWPALVKLTASEILVWSPALNADGMPDEAVPAGLVSDQALDLSAPSVRPEAQEGVSYAARENAS